MILTCEMIFEGMQFQKIGTLLCEGGSTSNGNHCIRELML